MYFKEFPRFIYEYGFDADGNALNTVVADITQNVRIKAEVLSNITLFDEYDMKEGETPEIVAEKVYGDSTYHWVIMLANERFDYVKDFPLTYNTLLKYVEDTYGAGNEYATHHYENEKGFVVDYDYPGAYPVSNLEYEERVNEAKRRIKIISPELLSRILKQFKDVI